MVKILSSRKYWIGELQPNSRSQEEFPMAHQIRASTVRGKKSLGIQVHTTSVSFLPVIDCPELWLLCIAYLKSSCMAEQNHLCLLMTYCEAVANMVNHHLVLLSSSPSSLPLPSLLVPGE